ncbi:regulator of telomere elongation helicase 1 homolog [Bradysia coprophila]|uniref:regulator of telomere elongation helicase 1 homolog n=1 Tax=Bradysia coprophila TaxID=38358 RepID=UPI00187DC870|nr:regulator of telomere elongation helicase 1 homolog [Bradysia coprophila]
MPDIVINDVTINFPYENPYNVQRLYMDKIVECLKESKNGVLESPTGTGKTLSLLCASLAWLKQIKDQAEILQTSTNSEPRNGLEVSNEPRDELPIGVTSAPIIPKIIYASRTHTQLTQVINELKGTSYNYMKVGVFASRDQLCIHPELASETNAIKTEKCKTKIKKKQDTNSQYDPETNSQGCDCSYYERYESLRKDETFRAERFYDKILDVEDLRTSGLDHRFCPYFMSKTLIDEADIIFMPYNYLLDPMIRNFIGVELTDAVIILDEAHNVPQVCEDSASIEFKSTHISDAVEEVKKIAEFATDNLTNRELRPSNFNLSELNDLEQILLRFGRAIDEIPFSRNDNAIESAEFDGDYIFTVMENADIAYHTSRNILMLIQSALEYVADCIELLRSKEVRSENRSKVILNAQSPGLRKFKNILWTTFPACGDDFRADVKTHYRVYATWDRSPVVHSNGRTKVFNYWCFSPKFGLQYLLKKNVRSIIFTSGTMSPLQPFITSLGIPIEVQLQNGHIIDPSQVLVEIVSHGPDRIELLSTYLNRSKRNYLNSLGCTILKFCGIIPNGLLIFFPTYEILKMCKTSWQNMGIWSQIELIKPIFVEPKFKDEFTHTMQNYYKQINNETANGAIFMAVCRGKVSEGLDFADINGRAVIITGLPLAPCYDAKVVLKRNYMEKNYMATGESLSGEQWYQMEASRAVNQAIGRVIRHRHDYGAILLCDSRFDKTVQKRRLSQWLQRYVRSDSSRRSFDAITNSISQFFRNQRSDPLPVEVTTQTGTQSDILEARAFDTSPLQNNRMPSETNGNSQVINLRGTFPEPESPITSFTRQIASLPISSPLSENTPVTLRPTTADSNGTPTKRKCTVNLSQWFNEQP